MMTQDEQELIAKPPTTESPVEAIGFIVWWELSEVEFSVVNKALRSVGIEPRSFIVKPTPIQAITRACEIVDRQLRGETRRGGERYMIRPISTSSSTRKKKTCVHYAAVKEDIKDDVKTQLIAEFVVEEGSDLSVTGDDNDPIIWRVLSMYDCEREICSGERIGRALVTIVEEGGGILLRPGVYYLPTWGLKNMAKCITDLRAILSELDGSTLREVIVYGDRRSLKTIIPAMERRLNNDIAKLSKAIDGWTGYQRFRMADTQVMRLNPIRKRIEHYERLTGKSFFSFKRECDKLGKEIERKLKQRPKRRKRLEDLPVWETEADDIEAKLNLRQRQLYAKMKVSLGDALLNKDPYIRNICDVALAAVAKDCGVEAANKLIEEFELTKECGVKPLEEKP